MKLTRMVFSVAFAVFAVAGSLSAAIITQNFDTGTVLPGASGSTSQFDVNKFDTSLGTLTRVTISMSLETWGGHYEVINATSPSSQVTGTMYVGIRAYLENASTIPSGIPVMLSAAVFAGSTDPYTLDNNGDTERIDGPNEKARITAGPISANASAANFSLYEGAGTFAVNFSSYEGSRHEGAGAVNGSFSAASSKGYLTVTYEYDPIPEPATLGLLLLGVGMLAVRRRVGRKA